VPNHGKKRPPLFNRFIASFRHLQAVARLGMLKALLCVDRRLQAIRLYSASRSSACDSCNREATMIVSNLVRYIRQRHVRHSGRASTGLNRLTKVVQVPKNCVMFNHSLQFIILNPSPLLKASWLELIVSTHQLFIRY